MRRKAHQQGDNKNNQSIIDVTEIVGCIIKSKLKQARLLPLINEQKNLKNVKEKNNENSQRMMNSYMIAMI